MSTQISFLNSRFRNLCDFLCPKFIDNQSRKGHLRLFWVDYTSISIDILQFYEKKTNYSIVFKKLI